TGWPAVSALRASAGCDLFNRAANHWLFRDHTNQGFDRLVVPGFFPHADRVRGDYRDHLDSVGQSVVRAQPRVGAGRHSLRNWIDGNGPATVAGAAHRGVRLAGRFLRAGCDAAAGDFAAVAVVVALALRDHPPKSDRREEKHRAVRYVIQAGPAFRNLLGLQYCADFVGVAYRRHGHQYRADVAKHRFERADGRTGIRHL